MMKTFTKILSAAFAFVAMASLSSCDDIKEQDRFIELPAIEAKRVVLMEEYTGQMCNNCPKAHDVVAKLLEQYPENLISVSIHGGESSWSETDIPQFGLCSAESNEYFTQSGVAAPPAATINRLSGPILIGQWAAAIRSELEKPSHIDIDVKASLSDDGKKIEITTTLVPFENIAANLQVWVVESGIIAPQLLDNNSMKVDYEHNHVFRAAVNGHNGQPVNLEIRKSEVIDHSIDVRDDSNAKWNAKNLSVVAFVYDKSGVQQAAITHVR